MRILGIDLGSRQVKIVLMVDNKIIKKFMVSTMSFYKNYCTYNDKLTADLTKLDIRDVDIAVSTGYGRNNTDIKFFKPISEIKAHAYGAIYSTNIRDFILLDVGGQDVKLIKIEKGVITDLELNDKCAASCGRYLENMANVLEVSIDDMFKYYENPVELNSTCAVFSESELIGKIAQGTSLDRLCAGVNYSLYKRLRPLLTKFRGKTLVISGGVAKNEALKSYLSENYERIITLKDAQYNGALGCCYYGERFKEKLAL
ncbi:R-phenyllactate dehydratase activator [Clostridium pasteurianum DSM 525 = ATCC 6013]|uniref:CoA-substrate-specific enzyme activase n=1 Tax=Clostridium pasteurianum DSM 525 = ATCC 6013 TaxID=1262449 RepID=A0A0H3J715_CLOPA|nr:acyl-CoA dehydratase activase [Clostridium pasteurianum]AJA47708.1 R-phenyllactate dehydratase activator [Clostridium pasteurianum DSM 525 = ATCC 6013]AJA51696.1 R-phenyllactate dehydratase activator [Clostridium pasteurianum DSM 525 = ATCC 6013]AOZ75009.1 2-hydroxyglutaryl-CoA dehydratase [Clostridium pasteurianum DSM 525 = ATCC 6013]AOZ78804.1 2-hydroxyglutaryl-CoA dehydratase [Clostridium pasteurianum]ELP59610.1 2-hydroxyglutaryl-CoA dehydratase [Clostridium pasteurianum DSM 525 = ATCC 6